MKCFQITLIIYIYDIRSVNCFEEKENRKISISISKTWEELYNNSDIIITCTVADFPYIDLEPKEKRLLLNISLRDYKPSIYNWVNKSIIVDDWDEVCRENTDIENMHKKCGLTKDDTFNLYDILFDAQMDSIYPKPIMFNPMGLAIFDIAISSYYYHKLINMGYGEKLE